MKRDRVIAGWTRIAEPEFKAAIMEASGREPDLCQRLRLAIKTAAARRGVRREVVEQYLKWISEIEAALATVAEVQSPAQTKSPQAA